MTDSIGFPRWTQDATFSGGAWDPRYPVANLKTLPLARVARTAGVEPAVTKWRGAFSAPRLLQLVVLCRHNLTLAAKWRVRVFAHAADVAPAYDSGFVEVWPPVLSQEEASWDGGNWWDLKYTAEEIEGEAWDARHLIAGGVTCMAFEIEVLDPTNPAGYLEFGLCEAASLLDLPIGTAFGAQVGWRARTNTVEADGGVKYHERRAKPRTFTGQIAAVHRTTALSRFYEMQRRHDLDVPFYWWPMRETESFALRTAFLATQVALDPITQAYTAHDVVVLNLEQVL